MIAERVSPLALKSRRSLLRRATPTSRSAARNAEQPRSRKPAADVVVLAHADRCILQYVPHATRLPKFPSSLVATGQYIAAHATMPLAVVLIAEPGDNLKKEG